MRAILRISLPDRGFTVIELMIALAIMTIVSLAAFTVLSSSQRAAVTNDQTVQIQQNVRIAMDMISRDIRMAGYGNPAAPNAVPIAGNCTAIMNPVNSNGGPDQISILTIDQVVGQLTVNAPQAPANQITLNSVAGLSVNDVITLDGVFTATVNAINVATGVLTLNANIQAPAQFSAGEQVVRLACVRYTVAGNQLLRDGVAVVDGILDLQLAYGVDVDADGRIDDQAGGTASVADCLDLIPNVLAQVGGLTNSAGCAGAGLVAAAPTGVPPAPQPSTVRLVRISVVGQASRQDTTWTSSSAVTVEDRNLPTNSGFRRRVLTRTVNMRNVSS